MFSWKKINSGFLVLGAIFAFFVFLFGSSGLYAEQYEQGKIDDKASLMKLESDNGWKLDILVNSENEAVSVLQDTAITLLFQDDRISGKSGCNRYFADYKVNGNDVTVGKTASTMMACPEPIMKQERDYLEQLSQVKSYAIENEALHLRNDTGEVVLIFSAFAVSSLTDGIWQLSSFNTGNALLSNRVTEHITGVFDNEGSLSGFAGCNQYSCSYKVDGDKLELSPIITTRKYCHDPENVMKTEAGFISALGEIVRYSIKNNELFLFNEEDKPVVIFNKPGQD